ncbi:MAG: efflux RND transporter periplasmic adaptor subunit [Planctomycetota bacterium]|jgi:multidrug resistance efflux pump|nr:efflux RND transporter periplasmic adaptor subunit [Planctomycetota bacterium]
MNSLYPRKKFESFAWIAGILCLSFFPTNAQEEEATVIFRPRREAVLSAIVSSRIVRIVREAGETIEKGEPLIELDNRLHQIAVEAAEASLVSAQADLEAARSLGEIDLDEAKIQRAQALLDRAKARLTVQEQLFEKGSLSVPELEGTRTEAAVAQANLTLAQLDRTVHAIERTANLARAEANVRTAQTGLARARLDRQACLIQAPFSGRVRELFVAEHEATHPGRDLIALVDDRTLQGHFLVPSKMVVAIQIGRSIPIRIRETEQEVTGTVSQIGALVDPTSSTLRVLVKIDNPDRSLRAGFRGVITLKHLVGREE